MKLKMYGGTRSGVSLCQTCSQAHIRKGAAMGQEVVKCHASSYENPDLITYAIVECRDYRDKSLPSLHEMTKIATFINADRKTGKMGFASPEQDQKNNVERERPDSPFE